MKNIYSLILRGFNFKSLVFLLKVFAIFVILNLVLQLQYYPCPKILGTLSILLNANWNIIIIVTSFLLLAEVFLKKNKQERLPIILFVILFLMLSISLTQPIFNFFASKRILHLISKVETQVGKKTDIASNESQRIKEIFENGFAYNCFKCFIEDDKKAKGHIIIQYSNFIYKYPDNIILRYSPSSQFPMTYNFPNSELLKPEWRYYPRFLGER